ncbi:helix-turn-helix domain-containing protein, partial [Psychrobacter sp. AOP1-A1-60]|uniref:helix-turn-helix domain-containing protein n=1 Tax=Psychrobacter sp. AOP1-A1-60 TaxID=3457727 RepID=UPI004035C6E9
THWNAIVEPPTPEQIKDFRERTNMTQDQAASLLGLSNKRLIADYETGVSSPNPQTWTLWLLLTGQHPTLKLSER